MRPTSVPSKWGEPLRQSQVGVASLLPNHSGAELITALSEGKGYGKALSEGVVILCST